MIHQLKIDVVCRPEDWIRDVPSDYLCYSLRDSLFYSNGCEAEDVLKICLVLRVDVFFISGYTLLSLMLARLSAVLDTAITSRFLI